MRLIDCFTKTLAYVAYLVRNISRLQPPYEGVRTDLEGFFRQAWSQALSGGFTDDDFALAKFAVCAWVDETIMLSEWTDRTNWSSRPLQREHFNTTNAGVEFFETLSNLAPDNHPVREVYVTCLAMGFTGSYFGDEQKAALTEQKNQALMALRAGAAEDVYLLGDHFLPEAYPAEREGFARKKSWSAWNPTTVIFFLLPPAILITLFVFYRYYLNRIIYNFFQGSG